MAEPEPLPRIDPIEAIAYFRAKGWEIAFDWRDVWQEEHARAFTVAKAMSRDLLEDIRAAVDAALAEGQTLEQFSKDLRPRLAARGWWGRKWMTDPATGEERVVQLGSPARLRTIYETNLRTSYMAGRWQRIERTKKTLPLLRYVSVMDGRERPEHHDWHNTILPVDHPWWDTHFPPCGWGCRCDTQALNQRMLDRKGWSIQEPPAFPERDYVNRRTGEITRLERGIDPGWSYNVGKASLDALTPAPRTRPIDDEESTLNSVLSEGDFRRVKGFFAAFGLATRIAAQRGKVWEDAAGWPMAISAGLFRRADGAMTPAAALPAAAQLANVGKVLAAPDRIGLVWVRGKDGRAMLVRRYVAASGVVDVGRDFWRWHVGSPARFPIGTLAWSAEDAELASRDHYKRDDRGRFARVGGTSLVGFLGSAIAGEAGPARHDLGPLPAHGQEQLNRLGISGTDKRGKAKTVSLDRSLVRHATKRHAGDGRGQIGLTDVDFANMPALLGKGTFNHGNPARAPNGSAVVYVTGSVGRRQYAASFEVRKHTVVPQSIRRKK